MKKVSFMLLIAIAALITQCKKESAHVWNDPNPSPGGGTVGNGTRYSIEKGAAISMDAFGIVQDEQGNPLSGVNITLGSKTYTSNQYGQVKIYQGSAFEHIAFIKAEKSGYFSGSRSFIPQPGVNQFIISLMAKGSPQVFQASSGATLQQGNSKVEMGKSFVDGSGNAYTGEIKAYVRHLDPKDPNLQTIMPGDLRGANASGEKVLETYGMLVVDLEGAYGQKLQPAKGHPATIKLTVPSSMLTHAPSTIPLWHFDEVNGIWSEDGEAKLVDGVYIGAVSHFSFWNCDTPLNFTELKATARSAEGLVIPGLHARITRPERDSRIGYIDDKGNFGGKIPGGEDLIIDFIFENTVLYSESFNSGNAFELKKNFILPVPDFATVSGTVLGCNGSMIPTGSILINNYQAAAVVNGSYSFQTLLGPNRKVELTAIYLYGGNSQTRTITVDKKNVNVAAFGLCPANASIDDYAFTFIMDGTNYSIEGVKAAFDDDSTLIFTGGKSALDFSTDHAFDFSIWKEGDWASGNQFQMGIEASGWNGQLSFDIGDGFVRTAKLVDINVIGKNPYSINFSGTFQYYDSGTQSYQTVNVTNGKVIEK